MRLALLYGGLFFVAGSMLLWVTYLLTARAMNTQFVTKFGGSLIAGTEEGPPDAGSPVRQVRVDVEQGAATVLNDIPDRRPRTRAVTGDRTLSCANCRVCVGVGCPLV
ncbi:hypothetical protein [Nonomuraea sp. NPDC049158]|uniref:hypothetical protein n=1 Tax=Nonomuraea sp. NPDC049158 TaxID=3155649 RepID=UPI0033F48DC7